MSDLTGRVALVTGAARGQGRSHCVRLAEDGADIIAIDALLDFDSSFYPMASQDDLDETVRQVEALGRRIVAIKADVRSFEQLQDAVNAGLETFGRLDIVCANAGIATNMKVAWEKTEEEWQDTIDVNLTGVWHTVKATVPAIIAGGRGGAIVLTSSLAGLKGYSHIVDYVAAKHGVNGIMRVLANEVGQYNIRVNTVCPGLIHTDMMMNDPTYQIFRPEIPNATKEDATEVFKTMQVLPTNWLEPRDVSNVIAFLVSDAARYITGVSMPVDGGQIGRG